MKLSIISGELLPESAEDFRTLIAAQRVRWTHCSSCREEFTGDPGGNVHSTNGWKETQISGFCEDCFDGLFKEPEEA